MSCKRFNRHESIDSETRTEIMDLIIEMRGSGNYSSKLGNMLFGLFDGYLYDDLQIEALKQPTKIATRIMKVYFTCSRYPESLTQTY